VGAIIKPSVYIIGGPNGAGKTTFAREFLPNYADCKNFINTDLIAQGVSPFSPEAATFRAGRMMLEEIDLYARRGESFGFETTLSGRSYLSLIRRLKRRGYEVHFFYLWVPSVELALSRIRGRVSLGGHDVPALMCAVASTGPSETSWFTIGCWRIRGLSTTIRLQCLRLLHLRNRASFR